MSGNSINFDDKKKKRKKKRLLQKHRTISYR